MRILLASPRGFCAGVDRAIEIVEAALARFGPPVYVRHEIVHNRHVVDELRKKGAVFVDEPGEAPRGALLIYSAHGVSPAVRKLATPFFIERARFLGGVMRVVYLVSASMPGILPRTSLTVEGGRLVLRLPKNLRDLAGDRLANRVRQLARLIGVEPAVEVG